MAAVHVPTLYGWGIVLSYRSVNVVSSCCENILSHDEEGVYCLACATTLEHLAGNFEAAVAWEEALPLLVSLFECSLSPLEAVVQAQEFMDQLEPLRPGKIRLL